MESMSDCIPQRIVAGGVGQLATLGAFTQNDKCQQHELQMLCWREAAKVACLFDPSRCCKLGGSGREDSSHVVILSPWDQRRCEGWRTGRGTAGHH